MTLEQENPTVEGEDRKMEIDEFLQRNTNLNDEERNLAVSAIEGIDKTDDIKGSFGSHVNQGLLEKFSHERLKAVSGAIQQYLKTKENIPQP